MPIYTLKCSECGKVDEYLLAICEEEVQIPCTKCGSLVSRKNNRVYLNTDAPAVVGQTVVRIQKTGQRQTWKNTQTRSKKARKKTTELK